MPGEIWENPVNREGLTIMEHSWDDSQGRATFEMAALVGSLVAGKRRHPAIVEGFTVVEGELTVKRNGQTDRLDAIMPSNFAVESQANSKRGT